MYEEHNRLEERNVERNYFDYNQAHIRNAEDINAL